MVFLFPLSNSTFRVCLSLIWVKSTVNLHPENCQKANYSLIFVAPIGITLAIKLIPRSVLEECRVRALETIGIEKPVSWFAGFVIILIWLILTALCVLWFMKLLLIGK